MPEISRFFGIVIKMFFADHNLPHFHAFYGGDEALVAVRNLSVFAGRLPPRALGLVIEWATLHQQDLLEDWQRAKNPLSRSSPSDEAANNGIQHVCVFAPLVGSNADAKRSTAIECTPFFVTPHHFELPFLAVSEILRTYRATGE